MPAKKKSPAKKTTAKKSPAKKAAAKKSPVKKSSARKSTPKKSTTKKTTVKSGRPTKKAVKAKAKPAGPREDKVATEALKLVDQATALLRKGIRTGAKTTSQGRVRVKQDAHTLLNTASSNLNSLVAALRKGVNKL